MLFRGSLGNHVGATPRGKLLEKGHAKTREREGFVGWKNHGVLLENAGHHKGVRDELQQAVDLAGRGNR